MNANDYSPILDADLDDSLEAQLAYEAEQAAQDDASEPLGWDSVETACPDEETDAPPFAVLED